MGLKLGQLTRTVLTSACYLLVAGLATIVLMLAGTSALYVTSAPAWVSLFIEPLSLLLLPGLIFTVATSGSHDFVPEPVIVVSAAFYFGLLCAALFWRGHRRRRSELRMGGSR